MVGHTLSCTASCVNQRCTYSTPYLTVHDLRHRGGSMTMECERQWGTLVLPLWHCRVEFALQLVSATAMRSEVCTSQPMHLETL